MQELTFKDILKIVLPKLKMLIAILLLGAIVGGFVGAARTYASRSYGTKIVYYVSPKPSEDSKNSQSQYGIHGAYAYHVMDSMTKLLESESFAEQMLLGDDGLPLDTVLAKEVDRTEIDAKIAEARAAISEAADARAAADAATENKDALEQEAKQKLEAADLKLTETLDFWRTGTAYKEYILTITQSVGYEFIDRDDVQMTTSTDTLAKSFISVTIASAQSEEMANFVYERIKEKLPGFVEANMSVPSGYIGTKCQRITRLDEIKETSSDELFVAAIKYALVFAALAFFIGAVGIVVISRTKSWYRENKNAIVEGEQSLSDESKNKA